MFWIPKKNPYFTQATQKNPGRKFQTPKNSFKSGEPPWGKGKMAHEPEVAHSAGANIPWGKGKMAHEPQVAHSAEANNPVSVAWGN